MFRPYSVALLMPFVLAPAAVFAGCGGGESGAGEPSVVTEEVRADDAAGQAGEPGATGADRFGQDLTGLSRALGSASATLAQSLSAPGPVPGAAMREAAGEVRAAVDAMQGYTVPRPAEETLRAIIVEEGPSIAAMMDSAAEKIATGNTAEVESAAEGLSAALTRYTEKINAAFTGQP
jgi:hypothetical protein